MWIVPLLLLVPNIGLTITEHLYNGWEKAANLLLPLGVYCFLASCWKRVGITTLLSLPLMILCAFQIVLLFLYGESIIAIDMFLNVATTNYNEATELLSNLTPAILTVCTIYLPPLVAGIVVSIRHEFVDASRRRVLRMVAATIYAAGMIAAIGAYRSDPDYSISRKLFPVNVVANIHSAIVRAEQSSHYPATSENFRFGSRSTRPDSIAEVYVMVIGETSRAGNWQLNGYSRPTNPKLCKRLGVVNFSRTLSESNTTHKSVPLMMSHLNSKEFGDSIYRSKGIIDAFKEAGFTTAWISNQKHNGSFIDCFGQQADSVVYLSDDNMSHFDGDITDELKRFLASNPHRKVFVAIHTYGSHFNYRERYPDGFDHFHPDNASEARAANRQELMNAYDNSILYTDAVLDSIIGVLADTGRPAALVYTSDHGEDIFDDCRGRFLHASPHPTYYQIHVPMIAWTSESFAEMEPEAVFMLDRHSASDVSSSLSVFHTLVGLAGIATPRYNAKADLSSNLYTAPERIYLNDYNEAVALGQSGLRNIDISILDSAGISKGIM